MDSTATYDRDTLEKKLDDPSAPPICLPIQFLKDITCNFSREEELGRGGYGVVYKGVLRSGKIIAVKKIFGIHLVEDDDLFRREVRYLMGIEHQNIVKLVGYCAESSWEAIKLPSGRHTMAPVPTRLLCFEYLCNNTLKKHVSDESSGLDWYKRFEIIKGICSGLRFLHEKRIVHRDLKPGNIVMDATMMPKIIDFGLSRLLGIEKSATIISRNREGSLGYMAPEYIYQGQISPKADIFSFGVIIIEIITGCKTIDYGKFVQPSSNHQSFEIARQQYIENVLGRWRKIFKREPKYRSSEIYVQQVKECITIALRCVDHDKLRRPNACEILQMLSAVESTKFHVRVSKDSIVYQRITKDFSDDLQIGSGGFAAVYKGFLGNGRTVAVKKLCSSFNLDEAKWMKQTRHKYNQEVDCLMREKHKNIVRFLGYCADTHVEVQDYKGKFVMADVRHRLLCFEYISNGSLGQHITDASCGLEWGERYKRIKGICQGLRHLHEQSIFHLDLKPANTLLDDNMVAKLSDFCISRGYSKDSVVYQSLFGDRMSGCERQVQRGRAPVPVGGRPKKEPRAAPNRRRERSLQQPPQGRHH